MVNIFVSFYWGLGYGCVIEILLIDEKLLDDNNIKFDGLFKFGFGFGFDWWCFDFDWFVNIGLFGLLLLIFIRYVGFEGGGRFCELLLSIRIIKFMEGLSMLFFCIYSSLICMYRVILFIWLFFLSNIGFISFTSFFIF